MKSRRSLDMPHTSTQLAVRGSSPAKWRELVIAPDMNRIAALTENDASEALEFLAARPVQTVVMSSFINDNGMVSSLNRGTFYGFRGRAGKLEGVALIGHTTLVEARSEAALM